MKLNHPLVPLTIILLLIPTIFPTNIYAEEETEATEEPISKSGFSVLAADVFELNLDFDTTLDIQGETRFFSSRHNKYVGGRIVGHFADNVNKTFYKTTFFGIVWGKSSFLMNWEEPGLVSFEPLEASVSTISFPLGVDLNLNIGNFLKISPYVSAKMMFLRMNLEIGGDDFDDTVIKLGFDAGARVTLTLGKWALTAGAGLTHILNEEIEFELDDSVTFESHTSGSSPEYFLGLEL